MSTPTETNEPPPEIAKPGRRRALMIAIAIGALSGVGTGLFALGPAIAGTPDAAVPDADTAAADHAPSAPEAPPLVLSNLVLNPAASRGTRFLLVSVAFEFVPAMPAEQFAARETEVRDRVLAVLGTRTVDELVDHTRRDAHRAAIATSIDSLVGAGRTRRVFFPQFVIQ